VSTAANCTHITIRTFTKHSCLNKCWKLPPWSQWQDCNKAKSFQDTCFPMQAWLPPWQQEAASWWWYPGYTSRDRLDRIWVADRITFRLAVLIYRCLHSSAPEYLSKQLQRVSEVHTHRRLRSSSSTVWAISRTCRATIGGSSFSAAATAVWNSLPEAVRSSPSLSLFRKSLKTELFARSYTV